MVVCAAPWVRSLSAAWAAESGGMGGRVYADNQVGSDDFNGQAARPVGDGKTGPCATISAALRKVPTGGLVSVANTGKDYREAVRVANLKKGRPGHPLVLEGNGAAVSGLVTVPAALWTLLRDGVYWFEDQGPDRPPHQGGMPSSNWLAHNRHQGWFTERQAPEIFFLNGRAAPHVRELAAIPEAGFFYDTQASPRRLYFREPAGVKLEACTIDIPLNPGVFVDDDYVVVRNLLSRYSHDDGFAGFWGIGVVFENCNGSFNCDQGISLHGTSTTIIDGGLFERNGGCGIADVMSSITVYRNVVVRDNMIAGAWLAGLAHSFLSCRFSGNCGPQVTGAPETALNLTNCLLVGNPADGAAVGVSMDSGRLNHCTLAAFTTGVALKRPAAITNCILASCGQDLLRISSELPPNAELHKNVFQLGRITLAKDAVTAANWKELSAKLPWLSQNFAGTLTLDPPLYALPGDSPYAKSADYGTAPGAKLPPWTEWKVLNTD